MDKNEKKLPKILNIRTAIIFFIIIGLVAVWFLKNPEFLTKDKEQELVAADYEDKGSSEEDTNNEVPETKQMVANEDFELNITSAFDLEHLKSYNIPIVIDFGADSCIPCKEMAPVLVKLNEELRGKAIILFVDVWKNPELAKDYPISVIPTQIFFDKEGNPYVPSEKYANKLLMYSMKTTNEHVFTTHEGGITEEELLELLKEMGMEE